MGLFVSNAFTGGSSFQVRKNPERVQCCMLSIQKFTHSLLSSRWDGWEGGFPKPGSVKTEEQSPS